MSQKRFVIVFLATSVVLISIYAWVFHEQFGAPVAAEYWVGQARTVKAATATTVVGNKVLVVAGSSGLFGIDSAVMEAEVHRPVINMALHAGLSMDWLLKYADENSKNGDVIFMPLEYEYFVSDFFLPSAWMSTPVVAWDSDYFYRLDLIQKIQFATSMAPSEVAANMIAKLNRTNVLAQFPDRAIIPLVKLLNNFERQTDSTDVYSYLNMDLHGDIKGSCHTHPPSSIENESYFLSPGSQVNPATLSALVSASKKMEAQGKRLIVGFQPIALNSVTTQHWFGFKSSEIESSLRTAGLRVLGSPSDYYFNTTDFFDTPYHLNCDARSVRSKLLGKQLHTALQ